jgi:hypothetical protein
MRHEGREISGPCDGRICVPLSRPDSETDFFAVIYSSLASSEKSIFFHGGKEEKTSLLPNIYSLDLYVYICSLKLML